MPVKLYQQLVAEDNAKLLRSMQTNELDMNSVREHMFLISKDTKIVYYVTTRFISLSRKLHFINIFTDEPSELTYEITLVKELDEEMKKEQVALSRKAEKARKSFVKTHELVKDTILLPLLEAKIKRNKAKRQIKTIVTRGIELNRALEFLKVEVAKRKMEKTKRVPSYGEDE